MTVTNKTVTILGSTAKLVSFTVVIQPDGSYVVNAVGTATDGASFSEQISVTQAFPLGTGVLDNMAATALSRLRIANGLEV